MSYKIQKNGAWFDVIEHNAFLNEEKTIKQYSSNEDAKKLKKNLNLGGGFAGFTPDFFLIPIKIPS